MRRSVRRLCALALCLAILPFAALAEESGGVFEDMGRTYAAAATLLETDDYARAGALFGELDDYRDATKYAAYCDAMTALEEGDAEGAALLFQALRDVDFLDASAMYFYAQARRAEQEGELAAAIQLLEGIDALDSLTWLVSLKLAYAQAEGAQREPLPVNAREAGLAVVVTDWTDGLDVPAGQRKRSEFPLYELLLIDTFDYDSQGRPWDQTTLEMGSPYAVETLTDETPVFSVTESIYHMSEDEESSFRAGIPLETARVRPSYGTVIGQTVNVRQSPGGNRGNASRVVNKGDSVELLDVVQDSKGNPWREVRFTPDDGGDVIEGFIPEEKVVDLTALPEQEKISFLRGYKVASLAQSAPPVGGKADVYSNGQSLMLSYAPEDLLMAHDIFEGLGRYENSQAYVAYLDMLIAIEQGDYAGALAALPGMRNSLAAIAEASAKAGVYADVVRLPDEASLRGYILGRQAEAAGDNARAAEEYWANDTRDSVSRHARLMALEPLDVALRYKVNAELGLDVAALLNWLMERVCIQPACVDRTIHIAQPCGHCAYTLTELCGEPPCSVCEGYWCDGLLHEKICNYCGAFDCTDTRNGVENHGSGKCVQRKQVDSEPTDDGQNHGIIWTPPGWYDRVDSPVSPGCTCSPCNCPAYYPHCPC